MRSTNLFATIYRFPQNIQIVKYEGFPKYKHYIAIENEVEKIIGNSQNLNMKEEMPEGKERIAFKF